VYEGTFKVGQRDGTGTITLPDGFSYTGDWTNGEISGKGRATYNNGDVYEGTFVRGRRQGAGTMTYATGQTAQGEWVDGTLATAEAEAESAPPAEN
jgi:hypothetical protein